MTFCNSFFGMTDTEVLSSLERYYGKYLTPCLEQCLKQFTRQERLALIVVLSKYIYSKGLIQEYLIRDAITDTLEDLDAELCSTINSLEGISVEVAEVLLKLILLHLNER